MLSPKACQLKRLSRLDVGEAADNGVSEKMRGGRGAQLAVEVR